MKFAQSHGYIITANDDGTVPVNSRVVAVMDGDDALRAELIRRANAFEGLVEALTRCTNKLERCLVVNGTDAEFAEAAVAQFRAALLAAGVGK